MSTVIYHDAPQCEVLTDQPSAFVEPLADLVAERLLCVPASSRPFEYEIMFAPTPESARSLEAYDLASPVPHLSFAKRDSWLAVERKVRICYRE